MINTRIEYKLKKVSDITGETTLETDWIKNSVMEYYTQFPSITYGHVNSDSNTLNTTWNASDQGEALWAIWGAGRTIVTDALKPALVDEPQTINSLGTNMRVGEVIIGVQPTTRLIYDATEKYYYCIMNSQYQAPLADFTVNSVFTGRVTSVDNGTTRVVDRTALSASAYSSTILNTYKPIIHSWAGVVPAVVQTPTETLIISYKIIAQAPSSSSRDWLSGLSWFGNFYRDGGGGLDAPLTQSNVTLKLFYDYWGGKEPVTDTAYGGLSLSNQEGPAGVPWNMDYTLTGYQGYYDGNGETVGGSVARTNVQPEWGATFVSYQKQTNDTDLGAIRGTLLYPTYSNNLSNSFNSLELTKPTDNKTQNVYAHTATKDVPFFDATNVSTSNITMNLDTSNHDPILPEWWLIEFTGSGNIASNNVSYTVRKRYISSFEGNTYRPRSLMHTNIYLYPHASNTTRGVPLSESRGGGSVFRARAGHYSNRYGWSKGFGNSTSGVGTKNWVYNPSSLNLPRPMLFVANYNSMYLQDIKTKRIKKISPFNFPVWDGIEYDFADYNFDQSNYSPTIGLTEIDDISGDIYVIRQETQIDKNTNTTPANNNQSSSGYLFRISDLNGTNTTITHLPACASFIKASQTPIRTLVNPDVSSPSPAGFGTSLASNPRFTAVGQPNQTGAGAESQSGAVYVYNNSTGALEHTILNPADGVDSFFGCSVSLAARHDKLLVGAKGSNLAYLFDLSTSPATLITTLNNPNNVGVGTNDAFGTIVKFDSWYHSEYYAISAPGEGQITDLEEGFIYIYRESDNVQFNVWENNDTSGNGTGDQLGKFPHSWLIRDGFIVVGQPETTSAVPTEMFRFNSSTAPGYVGANSVIKTYLPTDFSAAENATVNFGKSILWSNEGIIISAPGFNVDPAKNNEGKVYIWDQYYTQNSWNRFILSPDPITGGRFGETMAISGNDLFISEPGSGRVYQFNITTQILKNTYENPTGNSSDGFGTEITLSGNYLTISAPNAGVIYTYKSFNDMPSNVLREPSDPYIPVFALGSPVAGNTHRTLWAMDSQHTLLKSVDKGETWVGYNETSPGLPYLCTNSPLYDASYGAYRTQDIYVTALSTTNLWRGRTSSLGLIVDKSTDEIGIIDLVSVGPNYGDLLTNWDWWRPSDGQGNTIPSSGMYAYRDSTSIYNVKSYTGFSSTTARNVVYASAQVRWRATMVNPDCGFWGHMKGKGAFSSISKFYIGNYTIPSLTAFRPGFCEYNDTAFTACSNAGNTSAEQILDTWVNFSSQPVAWMGQDSTSGYTPWMTGKQVWDDEGRPFLLRGEPNINYITNECPYMPTNETCYLYPADNSYTDQEGVSIRNSWALTTEGFSYKAFLNSDSFIKFYREHDATNRTGGHAMAYKYDRSGYDINVIPSGTYSFTNVYWDRYKWTGAAWEPCLVGETQTGKTIHTATEPLIEGATISFDDALGSQSISSGDYYSAIVCYGVMNDNAEEWTSTHQITSQYPTADATGLTGSTIALSTPSIPVRVVPTTTASDSTYGWASFSATTTTSNTSDQDNTWWNFGVQHSVVTGGSAPNESSNWYKLNTTIFARDTLRLGGGFFAYGEAVYELSDANNNYNTYYNQSNYRWKTGTGAEATSDFKALWKLGARSGGTEPDSTATNSSALLFYDVATGGYKDVWFGVADESQFLSNTVQLTDVNEITHGFRIHQETSDASFAGREPYTRVDIVEDGVVVATAATALYAQDFRNSLEFGGGSGPINTAAGSNSLAWPSVYSGADYSSFKFGSSDGQNVYVDPIYWANRARIERVGTVLTYWWNGVLKHTSGVSSTATLTPAAMWRSNRSGPKNSNGTGADYSKYNSIAHLLDWRISKNDYWVKIGSASDSTGAFDPNIKQINGYYKAPLGVTIDGTAVTWIPDNWMGAMSAGECSLFPNEGYLRFSSADAGKTVASSTITYQTSQVPAAYSYALTNSSTDPTNVTWRGSFAPADYSFTPNVGISSSAPIVIATGMFEGNATFNDPDISTWNTRSITNMGQMLKGCTAFNSYVGDWDVSNVTNFAGLFEDCTSFDQDINGWDVSSASSVGLMLKGCTSYNNKGQPLTGNFPTTLAVAATGILTSLTDLFNGCTSFDQDLSSWDVSNIESFSGMFEGATSFNSNTKSIGVWNTSAATNMINMFQNASSFNQNLSTWTVTAISPQPAGFDTGASSWTLPRPNWGA